MRDTKKRREANAGSPDQARERFSRLCTACGACAAMCPPFSRRTVKTGHRQVQEQLRGYLRGEGPATPAVLERSRLCDECYRCSVDTCPAGLDPMRVNQLLRGLLHREGLAPLPFTPPSAPASLQRIAAALLTDEEEHRRITTPAVRGEGRTLFFPGCNVYQQPHLLLTALDLLELAEEHWSFLPGLDSCCGSEHDSAGRLEEGDGAREGLSAALEAAGAERVVLWCPTCVTRLHMAGSRLPVVSFPRFLAERLGGYLEGKGTGPLTLHEPCKTGYLGLDPEAPRRLLGMLAGEPVREMTRHGSDAACCNWSLHQHRPEAGAQARRQRLGEAAATGAGTLVTVCHGCQWNLYQPGERSATAVHSYVTLAGEAAGISHRDRCRELRDMEDAGAALASIRREMGERFQRLPFRREQVERAVELLFAPRQVGAS